MAIDFKSTITLGECIQIIMVLVPVFVAYNKILLKISTIEQEIKMKFNPIYSWWEHGNISAREYVDSIKHTRVRKHLEGEGD